MANNEEKHAKPEGGEKHEKGGHEGHGQEGKKPKGEGQPQEGKKAKGEGQPQEGKKAKGEGQPQEGKKAKGEGQPQEGKKAKGEGGDKKKGDGKGEAKKEKRPVYPKMIPRMFTRYKAEIVPALMKDFKYTSVMQVPRLKKISLNMGLGEAVSNPNIIKTAVEELTQIAGQKAVITRSKKSIANFKLRAGLASRLHGDAAPRAHVGVSWIGS